MMSHRGTTSCTNYLMQQLKLPQKDLHGFPAIPPTTQWEIHRP
jgi:hypothetical protein